MPRAAAVCSAPGCPEITAGGRCEDHRRQADRARGTAAQRGYTGREHRSFRAQVLRRDPICTWPAGCTDVATVADHHPRSRRELVAAGLNPNDPRRGRGLCAKHHNTATAQHQPGGWNANNERSARNGQPGG